MFVALTGNANWAVFFIMARFCISQMDVPARQTYVSMVVSAEERSAANGITNIARSVGVALAFPIAGFLW
jgi:predicted MFS family arabinose efflux permease